MKMLRRVAKNVAALFTAHFVVAFLLLALSVVIARTLGDVAFGKYSFVVALTAIFAIFSDLGYNTLMVRDVARDPAQAGRYLKNILGIRLMLSLIIFTVIVIIINVTGYHADMKNLIYVFAIYTLILSISDVFKMVFRASERMQYESAITIISNIVRVVLGVLVLLRGYGLMGIALVFLFYSLLDLLLSFLVCKTRFVRPGVALDPGFWKGTVTVALPMGLITILSLVYARTDTIMLAIMDGVAVVGWYNAAYNLVLGFTPIPHLFMNAILPLMSRLYVSSKDSLVMGYEKAFTYLLISGLPIAMGMSLLADEIILFLYGEQFANSVIALEILAWDVLLIFICLPLGFMLVAINRQNRMAVIVGGCALLNIILNLILIPGFSYIGAAIATLITETVLFLAYFYVISKYLYKLPLHRIVMRPLIATTVTALFIQLCSGLNLIVVIISATALYLVVLYLIGGFDKDDRRLLSALISGKGM
ncbi:MAG: flippase [Euryarchaeota archaeon]|nr:flippase [Euryarchaeota archaeon]